MDRRGERYATTPRSRPRPTQGKTRPRHAAGAPPRIRRSTRRRASLHPVTSAQLGREPPGIRVARAAIVICGFTYVDLGRCHVGDHKAGRSCGVRLADDRGARSCSCDIPHRVRELGVGCRPTAFGDPAQLLALHRRHPGQKGVHLSAPAARYTRSQADSWSVLRRSSR